MVDGNFVGFTVDVLGDLDVGMIGGFLVVGLIVGSTPPSVP